VKTRSILGVGVLFAVSAMVTACGGSNKGTDNTGSPVVTSGVTSAAAAAAAPTGIKISDSSLGPILTDEDGRTLYAFLNDKNGTSSCTGDCVATWPALITKSPAAAGDGAQASLLSQTTRAEGTSQTTYNKWPLYYYAGDAAPGSVDGEGLGGVWFALGADGKLVKPAA
jgi:predicted lipoprotein with Yx(FWY)xxD motif